MSTDVTSITKGFDLAQRVMRETATFELVDPIDGKTPIGLTWVIKSQFSTEARAASAAATRITFDAEGKPQVDVTVSDSLLDQLCAVTVGWNITSGDVPVNCTPENVRAVLTNPESVWTRPQVQAKYLSLAGFFDSAKSN